MARRNRAKLTLSQRADGTVQVEIRTSSPLGPIVEGEKLVPPGEYLRRRTAVRLMALGKPTPGGLRWHMIEVFAQEPGHTLVKRHLDLSEGSHERAMVEALEGQREVPVIWVNESVETIWRLSDGTFAAWPEVVQNTRGLSAEQWREVVEEHEWGVSESSRPGPRPRKHLRRSATPPPGARLSFFAPRSGAVPPVRAPEVEGVRLPKGSRQPSGPLPAAYWCSDESVQNIDMLAPWLATAFPNTGLWPLLWRSEEDPESYMQGHGLIERIDGIDLDAIRTQHASEGMGARPRALSDDASGGLPTDPFPFWAFKDPARLLLVPCNRPADAVTALGGVAGEADPPLISAVLRCWEERHAAVLYEVGPGLIRLSVARPAKSEDQALAVAAEAQSIMNHHYVRSVPNLAHALLTASDGPDTYAEGPGFKRDNWDIGI